jgi:hypothetical protein
MHEFAGPSPEWSLFQIGVRALSTDLFKLVRADGTPLLDLTGRHWPCEVLIAEGRISFTVRGPGIRFPDLTDEPVYFEVADSAPAALPQQLWLRR